MRSLVIALAATLLAACASSRIPQETYTPEPPRSAWIVGVDGAAIGQATISEAPMGVLIRLEFSEAALPPGWHGAHIHGVGDCSDPAAGFVASTSHVGHGGRMVHGLLNPMGPESGDLPNVFATASGPFGAEFFSTRLTLRSDIDNRTRLLDEDGSALIIHAGPDDHTSLPIGGAGPRLGCAAFSALP
jgi:Cu-Zn family superoxide dismutase